MSRLAYPNEVGISDVDITEIRITTGSRPGHICKVRHRIFGWISIREWGIVASIRDMVRATNPTELAAWLGLTIGYKAAIDVVGSALSWWDSWVSSLPAQTRKEIAQGNPIGFFESIGFLFIKPDRPGSPGPGDDKRLKRLGGGWGVSAGFGPLATVLDQILGQVTHWTVAAIAAAVTLRVVLPVASIAAGAIA